MAKKIQPPFKPSVVRLPRIQRGKLRLNPDIGIRPRCCELRYRFHKRRGAGLRRQRFCSFGNGPESVPWIHLQPCQRASQREHQLPQCHLIFRQARLISRRRTPLHSLGFAPRTLHSCNICASSFCRFAPVHIFTRLPPCGLLFLVYSVSFFVPCLAGRRMYLFGTFLELSMALGRWTLCGLYQAVSSRIRTVC